MPNFIQSKIFSSHPEVIHGFTTRELGADYDRIAELIKIKVHNIITTKQIHSNQVVLFSKNQLYPLEGDAIVTDQPNCIIGIRTADCVPLLVYDPQKKVVSAIHAGWRGLVYGIIENSINQLKDFGVLITDLKVAIGPAICEKCFEVGPEVVEEFRKKFGDQLKIKKGNGDKSYLSLKEGCRLVLKMHDVPDQNIETLPYCTQCDDHLFYSYRRGDHNQRMFSFIGLV